MLATHKNNLRVVGWALPTLLVICSILFCILSKLGDRIWIVKMYF
ncbi:MAG: hypothetical protein ACFCU7_00290 [Pleurocapsa sp.]